MMDKERILAKYPYLDAENMWGKIRNSLPESRTDTPVIVVHGGYGKKNTGDDAILSIILDRLKKRFKNPRFIVACHGPEEVLKTHPGIEAVRFKSFGMIKAILSADIYIIGGGGIVNIVNTYSGFRKLPLLDPKGKFQFIAGTAAKLFGAKLVFYAIGVTSIPDAFIGFLASSAINFADYVTVRDPLSKINLVTLGVGKPLKVVFDPVTALQPCSSERAEEILRAEGIDLSNKTSAMNFRYIGNPDRDNSGTIRKAAELADRLAEEGYQPVFVPFSRHPFKKVENDLAFAEEILGLTADKTGLKIIRGEYRPEELMGVLGLFDVCVLSRLHAVLMARMTGKNVIAIAYDHKVAEFCRMAENRCCIPLGEFTTERVMKEIASGV